MLNNESLKESIDTHQVDIFLLRSKDHLFELVLPKACCVGHVDIKFTLHPLCPAPPKIQLTLLRQSGSQCLKIGEFE